VQAEIRISVEHALVAEHTDLVVADEDDTPLAVLEVTDLGDEFLGHFLLAYCAAIKC
jgi:hypothetical protein